MGRTSSKRPIVHTTNDGQVVQGIVVRRCRIVAGNPEMKKNNKKKFKRIIT